MKINYYILLLLLSVITSFAQTNKNTSNNSIASKNVFVKDLLSKMTLEEKLG
jgi:hypothetical protein